MVSKVRTEKQTATLSTYSSTLEGFKIDCATLLKSFAKTGRYDFDTFVEIWQQMKFSLIYCNCSLPELKLYSTHIFLVIKSYMIADKFKTLGPFYLMYSLYYKQPCKIALIRMTKEEMESLMMLTGEYAINDYYVPAYMLAKLQSEEAFFFTADSQVFAMDYNFERNFNNTGHFRNGIDISKVNLQIGIQTDFMPISLEIDPRWYNKWKAKEDEYNKLKSVILKDGENEIKKRKTKPNVSVEDTNQTLAPTNLLNEFQSVASILDKPELQQQKDKPDVQQKQDKPELQQKNDKQESQQQNDKQELQQQKGKPDLQQRNDKPELQQQKDNPESQQQKDKTDSALDSIGISRVRLKRKTFAAPVIFDKYDKKADRRKKNNRNKTVVTEANPTQADTVNEEILKKFERGKWKNFLKDAINQC